MKLLSVIIPCYNSQEYMGHCIESLLSLESDEVEVLIVNDGSADGTAALADQYEEENPGRVRALHQENRGHGGAINTGLEQASGQYVKVVDSDDWVDPEAFRTVVDHLRRIVCSGDEADLFISDYVYETEGSRFKRVVHFRNIFPEGRLFAWEEAKPFRIGQYLMMHSVIFRTGLLRECGLRLPEHSFYVDNVFVYFPLVSVGKLYYVSADFYRYHIGREDQSVNEQVMIRRIDQQLKVNRMLADYYVSVRGQVGKRVKQYMFHHLEVVTAISSMLIIRSGLPDDMRKKRELWAYIRGKDARLHKRLRKRLMGTMVNLPGRLGRKISVGAYKITQKAAGY